LIFVTIICLIVVLVLSGIHFYPKYKFNKCISLGEKYLDEMEYEEAILEFQKAISIDPSNVDSYEGIIEAYALAVKNNADNPEKAAGYYEDAMVLLENADDNLRQRNIEKLGNEFGNLLPYNEYNEVIDRYNDKRNGNKKNKDEE